MSASFAFQLFKFRNQLRRRAVQIVGTAVSGAFVGMLTSAVAARLLQLAPVLRLALLSRSTISALALEICKMLGVQPPALGLLAAFVTGLLAFPLGKPVLDALGVTDNSFASSCARSIDGTDAPTPTRFACSPLSRPTALASSPRFSTGWRRSLRGATSGCEMDDEGE